MPHIAIARLWFEGNSFTPVPTPRAAFASREWVQGNEALDRYTGTATELGGANAFLATRHNWQATVLPCIAAQPGGPMTDAAYEEWISAVESGLAAARFGGVYLSLHGACITESDPAADLTTLRRVRAVIGPNVPLVASFDPHCSMASEVAELLDGGSIYRTHPHLDMDAAANRALLQLERRLGGAPRAFGHVAKRPMIIHSFHMRSAEGPMAEVWQEAAAMEAAGTVIDASPIGGFSWSDSPYAGPGAMAWAETPEAARQAAETLADAIAQRRARFDVSLPGPYAALAQALVAPPGLVGLLEPSDNPLSGGVADTPGLLKVLLESGPPVETVFAYLHDPETVAAAQAAGEGATLTRDLAARITDAFGPPVSVTAVVERLTEGRFINTGPMEHGSPADFGPTAMLRTGHLRIIVTSLKEAAIDPAFFELHGIDLTTTRLLANKAKNHFRAAFASRCAAIIECDTPGPAALNLAALPFKHVPKSWLQ